MVLVVFLVFSRFVTPSSADETLEALPSTAETVKRKYNNYKKPESKRKYIIGHNILEELLEKWMHGRIGISRQNFQI